ncbi:hypothetical protein EVA_06155 [gut metagenome]|uniref:Uncharacterized protein n=1 Tax=gut metagenome TaxID=749906 RepID=J9GY73_9ZZZZ
MILNRHRTERLQVSIKQVILLHLTTAINNATVFVR